MNDPLWDAGRKCVDLIVKYRDQFGYALPGWRKAQEWRRQLKNLQRTASQIVYRGGPNKEARVKRAVRDYLAVSRDLAAKVRGSLSSLCDQPVALAHWEALEYFHRMLAKHLGNCARQLLKEVATVRSMDVVLPIRDPSSTETRQVRLRVAARPDRPIAELLVRLGLDLPNAPKLVQNVVEKNRG